jgi:ADP-heptose:LPS heptosyltransferase
MLTPSSSAPTLRVAIYRTSSLGDVVLATACLDLLEHLPVPTEITWIGRGAALETVTRSWPTVRAVEIGKGDTLNDLQRITDALAHHHLLIDLQVNLRSKVLAKNLKLAHGIPCFAADKAQLARSRLLLEARMRGRRRPLPAQTRVPPRLQYDLMCDALRRGLAHHLPVEMRDGLDAVQPRPRLPIPDAFDTPWRKELRFGTWLAVAPGAAYETKRAPLELLREIAAKVRVGLADPVAAPVALPSQATCAAPRPAALPHAGLGLAFFGDEADRQQAVKMLADLHWPGPVLNLAGRLSLWETAVALKETACLISNDSVLAHVAEAVDTPTAVLFGPTVEAFGFAPRLKKSRAFSALTGCRPCSKHGQAPCRYGDRLCFTSISPDDVALHVVGLLMAAPVKSARGSSAQTGTGGATAHTGGEGGSAPSTTP